MFHSFVSRCKKHFRRGLNSVLSLLFPTYCCVCGKRLVSTEEHTCVACLAHLPLTKFKGEKGNAVERSLWDAQICTEHASAFLFYHQHSVYSRIYFSFKYCYHPEVAVDYGRMMAQDLVGTVFFDGIDVIVPVPLSAKRFRKRGYNQSERLAAGVSQITGLPVEQRAVVRVVDNPTQTRLSTAERMENVKGIFQLVNPSCVAGKHVLLVDDVITTGSTLRACAHALLEAGNVKLSVLTLGTSERNRRYVFPRSE